MTHQEIFDTAFCHIALHGRSAKTNECLYRYSGEADDPRRCAVGVFIPDEMYDRSCDGVSLWSLLQGQPKLRLLPAFKDTGLLSGMQDLHDSNPNWKSPLDAQYSIEAFCRHWELDPTKVLLALHEAILAGRWSLLKSYKSSYEMAEA